MEVVDAAADEDCLDTIELLGDELGDELSDGLRTELGLEFEPVGSEGCTSSSWRRSSIRPTGGRLRSITISPFRASLARVDFNILLASLRSSRSCKLVSPIINGGTMVAAEVIGVSTVDSVGDGDAAVAR